MRPPSTDLRKTNGSRDWWPLTVRLSLAFGFWLMVQEYIKDHREPETWGGLSFQSSGKVSDPKPGVLIEKLLSKYPRCLSELPARRLHFTDTITFERGDFRDIQWKLTITLTRLQRLQWGRWGREGALTNQQSCCCCCTRDHSLVTFLITAHHTTVTYTFATAKKHLYFFFYFSSNSWL